MLALYLLGLTQGIVVGAIGIMAIACALAKMKKPKKKPTKK